MRTDDKRAARINLMKAFLASVDCNGKDESLLVAEPEAVFRYRAEYVKDWRVAP